MNRTAGSAGSPALHRLPILLLVALFGVLVLRTAWTADDAYITYRTVENFVSGRGLTWNDGERVQVFTHPLWMFVLAAARAATGSVEHAALAISFALSLAAALLIALRIAAGTAAAALALLVLIFSKSFVDYATSGLENPLTHLLLIAFACAWLRDAAPTRAQTGLLALLAGLLALNRLDCVLLVAPALALQLWRRRSVTDLAVAAAGFVPLAAWLAFALVYFGSPFPNTAFAKLNTGIGAGTLLANGAHYLLSTLNVDPVLMMALLAALLLPLATRDAARRAIVVGIALYAIYVVKVGGDFMTGRMLTGCLTLAVCAIVSLPNLTPRDVLLSGAAVLLLGLNNPRAAIYSLDTYGHGLRLIDRYGIADERAFYYSGTGLLRWRPYQRRPAHRLAEQAVAARAAGLKRVVKGNIGLFGYYSAPEMHVVDPFALADPLLARLPMDPMDDWGIGHYRRTIPDGYLESLETGRNVIVDEGVRQLYDRVSLVTRGDLFADGRWSAIIELNAGTLDPLVAGYIERGHWRRSLPLEYGRWRPDED